MPNNDLIANAYSLLLDRTPEPAAFRHWSTAMDNGMRKDEFIHAIVSSAEFREKSGSTGDFAKYRDVDLIVPIQGRQMRVPAADLSLVPHLLEQRSWEPHLTKYLAANLKPADVLLDVGANLGYFTVMFAAQVARIVAFEPIAMTHGYCQANIELNKLTNVDLYRLGLWHEETTLDIKVDPSSLMGAAVANATDTVAVEHVRCASLDGMIDSGELKLSRLDMIKMDIEGAELSALKGMRRTLARFRPKIIMELNRPALERLGTTVEQIWQFFAEGSYKISAFQHWEEKEPAAVANLDALKTLCPADGLIDILALPPV